MAEPPEPRQRLLEAGLELFARQGIGATGIEQLLERADVAKMTLYKQFGSKEGLAEAVLENYGQRVRSALFEGIEKAPGPRAALLSLFESAGRLVAAPDWRGCLFARAALEFGPPEDPLHQIASAHQALLAERLTELARAAGVAEPAPLVQSLLCLLDGLLLRSHVLRDPGLARIARDSAAHLLDAAGARKR
jgi:AcrR family transcriptional regulator